MNNQERLRGLRESKGFSQIDMANFLGITRPAYNQYEKGRRSPDIETYSKLASILECSIDYLAGRTDDPDPNTIVLRPVRLKEMREKFNYSSEYLAKQLAIDEKTYFKYENFELLPDIDMFYAMANLFDTSISYLAGITDNPGRVVLDPEFFKRRQEVEEFMRELEKDPELKDYFFVTSPEATIEGLQTFIKMLKVTEERNKEADNK